MTTPILRVQELKKIFSRSGREGFAAVDGVSFDVGGGECVGLIGESGSGKSTVANLVARLLDPTGGRIYLEGNDVTAVDVRAVCRTVQMVFQSPRESFDPRRTLGDGVGESLRNAGQSAAEARAAVAELFEAVGLSPDFASRYPHEVSGGQCQRAAIARAIAIGPKLLICDEATSALDVTVQADIVALLSRLIRARAMACLFICHDLALAQGFCDRLLVMREGKIVEAGATDEVIQSPKTEYTKMLLDSVL
ncbi:MAG: ABC transporter ATP-binding protein [Schwartzia sp.]|nr:ABC transporter ATP-binding protein [Schwartzia sp. (in: firmicutes)]